MTPPQRKMRLHELQRPEEEHSLLISVGYYLLLLVFVGIAAGWLYRVIP